MVIPREEILPKPIFTCTYLGVFKTKEEAGKSKGKVVN